jgi:hypothetical protein
MSNRVKVGVLLTPTQMDYIKDALKTGKPLKLNFSEKQVLGTHIFFVTKEQKKKLEDKFILDLTPQQLKRFAAKEGKGLLEEQEKEIKIKKELVKKDIAPRIKKTKLLNDIMRSLKQMDEFKKLNKDELSKVEDIIMDKLVIFGFVKPAKKGSGARQAFLAICDKLGIKTDLGECHLKGHNYTGPGTKIEQKISNLEEIDKKFKDDFTKLKLKDIKYTDPKWKPINRIDEISAVHDVQYRIASAIAKDSKDEIKMQNKADFIMMNKLRDVKKSNPTTKEKYEYYVVYPAILAKMNIEGTELAGDLLIIKDNIGDLYSVAKGSKSVPAGLYSIVTRTMENMADKLGITKVSEKLYGNLWNTLLGASAEFAKDVITDISKAIGSKLSGAKEGDKKEYEERLESIRKFETEELKDEEIKVETKEEAKEELPKDEPKKEEEQVKESIQEIQEEIGPQTLPTVVVTEVKPKGKKGKGIAKPSEYKKIHPLYTDEIEEFARMNNIEPFDFVSRNGDRPDINKDKHFILVNIDDKNGPGTHYHGIYIEDGNAVYFDPFGLPPPKEIKQWLKNNGLKIQYMSNHLQDKNSIMCGYFVSYFFYEMSKGTTPYDFLYERGFEHNDTEKNDKIIKNKMNL